VAALKVCVDACVTPAENCQNDAETCVADRSDCLAGVRDQVKDCVKSCPGIGGRLQCLRGCLSDARPDFAQCLSDFEDCCTPPDGSEAGAFVSSSVLF